MQFRNGAHILTHRTGHVKHKCEVNRLGGSDCGTTCSTGHVDVHRVGVVGVLLDPLMLFRCAERLDRLDRHTGFRGIHNIAIGVRTRSRGGVREVAFAAHHAFGKCQCSGARGLLV